MHISILSVTVAMGVATVMLGEGEAKQSNKPFTVGWRFRGIFQQIDNFYSLSLHFPLSFLIIFFLGVDPTPLAMPVRVGQDPKK